MNKKKIEKRSKIANSKKKKKKMSFSKLPILKISEIVPEISKIN
jgi:hypothetical protein